MTQLPAPDERELRRLRGLVVAEKRRNQRLSQQALADLVGLSRSQIAFIETGRRGMSEDSLRAIARVLGIKEAQLRTPELDYWRAA